MPIKGVINSLNRLSYVCMKQYNRIIEDGPSLMDKMDSGELLI